MRKTVHQALGFDNSRSSRVWVTVFVSIRPFGPLIFTVITFICRLTCPPELISKVTAMVGLSKSDEAFRPYFLVGKPTEAKLEGAFERAVAFLGEAPGPHQPTVIREDEIERFVSDLEKEMIVHNART